MKAQHSEQQAAEALFLFLLTWEEKGFLPLYIESRPFDIEVEGWL